MTIKNNENPFKIEFSKVTSDRKDKLEKFIRELEDRSKKFLGYQANHALSKKDNGVDYSEDLKDCLKFQINNIGDPYGDICDDPKNPKKSRFNDGDFRVNSKEIERAVLEFYAELWRGKPYCRSEEESCWGYVTSMGCTEANLYALKNARDYLSDRDLVVDACAKRKAQRDSEKKEPILFYSDETHYSVKKVARALKIKTFYEYIAENELASLMDEKWKRGVPTNQKGEIDIDELGKLVEIFVSLGFPVIICFNYGSPFKGAFDNIEEAGTKVLSILEKYDALQRDVEYESKDGKALDPIKRANYWFHSDGALGAAYMPYLKKENVIDKGCGVPEFDFALKYYDKNGKPHDIVQSISMSGHKWIGAPFPCGIYMTRRKYQVKPPDKVDYIGSADTTFAGSRNGLSSLIFWDYLAANSENTQIEKANKTLGMAQYTEKKLREFGESHILKETSGNLKDDCLNVQRAPFSLSIRFRKINHAEIIKEFSLSEAKDPSDGEKYNHIYTMSHVSKELIAEFITALEKSGLFEKKQIN